MCNYQPFNIGIEFNNNYLTEVIAYFIGGIIAADEYVYYNDDLYWLAPVRHNPSYINSVELDQHYTEVNYLGKSLSVETLTKDEMRRRSIPLGKFNRLTGFATFFKSTNINTDIAVILPQLKSTLYASPINVKRSFLAGVFDGRGAVDYNTKTHDIRFISLDATNNTARIFLNDFAKSMGYVTNSNFSRERLEGGEPRDDQFRIKNVNDYIRDIGYISTKRMNVTANSTIGNGKSVHNCSFLPGLKQLY